MFFVPGQTIVRRNVHPNGMIAAVETARVIHDDRDCLLTWTARGSDCMFRATVTGAPIRSTSLAERDRTPSMLWPCTWDNTEVLIRTAPNADHSVWWFFGLGGRFEGWYVNLESPGRRWPGGMDIHDHALDIRIQPDLSWSWKDENELIERIGHPAYWTEAEAVRIRQAGERLIPVIEAGEFPFDGYLTDFRADPAWSPTRLPPYWDTYPMPIAAGSD
jgi:hypothetical protein